MTITRPQIEGSQRQLFAYFNFQICLSPLCIKVKRKHHINFGITFEFKQHFVKLFSACEMTAFKQIKEWLHHSMQNCTAPHNFEF